MNANSASAIMDLQSGLRRARRRLYLHALGQRGIVALRNGLFVLLATAVVVVGINFFGPAEAFSGQVGLLGALAALGLALGTMLPALWRWPSLPAAAERLDLAAATPNAIASAWCFLQRPLCNAFEAAAVEQGLATIRRIERRRPYLDAAHLPYRSLALLAAATIAVWALPHLLTLPAGAPTSPAAPPAVSAPTSGEAVRAAGPTESPANDVAVPHFAPAPAAGTLAAVPLSAARVPPPDQAAQQASTPGQAGAAQLQADTFSNAAGLAGQSQTAPASAEARPHRQTPREQAGEPSEQAAQQHAQKQTTQDIAGVGAGAPGRPGPPAAAHHWMHRDQVAGDPAEGDFEDTDVEDNREANIQRGGIQPHLQDRSPAPTRDLGISSGEGQPGTGRGGPTPTKRSRGTAALVLGITVPDFIRGQLGPGASKIIHERTRPLFMPGPSAQASAARPRALNEAACAAYAPPPSHAETVRRFLIYWHTQAPLAPASDMNP